MYQIIPHEAHTKVAQMCMRSISVFLKAESSCRSVTPLHFFPMLSYVLSSGFVHLAHVDPESAITLDVLQSLASDVLHHPSHWELLCELRDELLRWPYPPWPSSRHDFVHHILIAYSSPGLLKLFLSCGYPRKPRIKTNPLVYAADLRKTEHAMVLSAHGADVNMPGLVVDDSRYALPLDIAIDLGEDILVGELLDRGCVVTSEVLTTAVCMPWCSSRVLLKLMRTDEFVTWAHEIGDEKLYRGVFNSARPNGGDSKRTDEDHVAMARILRQIGQDLSADSRFGAELVERAIHAAHISMLEFLFVPDRPPSSRFLIAASTGDTPETVPVVRFLLRKGVDIHAISDGQGHTALHLAVRCPWEPRRLELVQLLMEAGCNPTTRNSEGKTVLALAIELGYSSTLELLLSHDVPIPSDILPFALQERSALQVVEFLIQRGADLHSTFEGNTVFHLAVIRYSQSKCLELVKTFIKAGCIPNTTNSWGKTIFEVAIEHEYTMLVELLMLFNLPLPPDILLVTLRKRPHSSRMIKFLIQKGADLHSTTSTGDTVLHLAITEYPEFRSSDLVQNLVRAGCNPASSNYEGKTAFEAALERGYSSVLGILLSHNFPLPSNVLLFALQKRTSLRMVKFLIWIGANLHSTTSDGESIFHLVVGQYPRAEHVDLVKSFIEAGCNPNASNSEGRTVFEAAVERNHTELVELLLSHNVALPSNILSIALQRRLDFQTVEYLIRKGANLYSTTSDGNTIFHLAIAQYPQPKCLDIVKSFLKAGCNPNTFNSGRKTVLEVAVEHGYTELVELLLSHNVALPSNILPTALQKRSDLQIVESLIRRGADLYSTVSDGNTIFHLAITQYPQSTCMDMVKSFVKAGCNPNTSNSKGISVLEVAIEHKYTELVKLLLSHNTALPSNILPIALQKRSDPQIVESFIRKGADLYSTMSDGTTIFHLAIAQYPQPKCLDMVRSFIDAGCNPNASVFEVAIEREYTSVVELLRSYNISFPPDILSITLRKSSAPQMIQLLVRRGANVHPTTSDGTTIFHLTIAQYPELMCLDLVRSFVEAGSNSNVVDSEGRSVFEFAIERRYISLAELLRSYRVPLANDILPIMLQKRLDPPIVRFLIQIGADLHSTTSTGNSIHHLAITEYCELDCWVLIKSFVTAGCYPFTPNSRGQTALEIAIERRYTSVLQLLSYDSSFPFDVIPFTLPHRRTPQITKPLVLKGADARPAASAGDTALHFVITECPQTTCLDLVKRFIKAGCNPAICNSEGLTALETALQHGYDIVVEYLLSCGTPCPPYILPMAFQKRLNPCAIESMIRNGADVHFMTPDGEITLCLAINAGYSKLACLNLVKILVNAGCAEDSDSRKAALEAAITKRGYTSVVQFLLSCDIHLSSLDILSKALQKQCSPQMIRFLARKYLDDIVVESVSHWDTLLELVHASYSEQDCHRLLRILDAARMAKGTTSNS